MIFAEILVYAVLIYLAIGFVFAVYFVFFGVGKIDAAAKNAGPGFRLIILPGAAALWMLLAWRLLRGTKRPAENTAHRRKAAGEKK